MNLFKSLLVVFLLFISSEFVSAQENQYSGYNGPMVGPAFPIGSLKKDGLVVDSTFNAKSTGLSISIFDCLINIDGQLGVPFEYFIIAIPDKLDPSFTLISLGFTVGLDYHFMLKTNLSTNVFAKGGINGTLLDGGPLESEFWGVGVAGDFGAGLKYYPWERLVIRLDNSLMFNRVKLGDIPESTFLYYRINFGIGYALKSKKLRKQLKADLDK